MFGSVALRDNDGSDIMPPSVSQRRLLAFLASKVGRPLTAAQIADELEVSAGSLRTTVSRLRRSLGEDVLVNDQTGYTLHVTSSDVERFEALLAESDDLDPGDALPLREEALALAVEPPYAGLDHEAFLRSEVTRLNDLRAYACERQAEDLLALGQFQAVLETLRAHIEEFPFRDHPRGLCMQALAAAGRQTEALRLFGEYREFLGEEVGVLPSEDLARLDQQIAMGEFVVADVVTTSHREPTGVRANPPVERPRHNLATARDAFVDEDARVDSVSSVVRAERVTTLTGPGGIGKTRLAVEVGRLFCTDDADGVDAAEAFHDGVWFIDLIPTLDGHSIALQIATVLDIGVPDGASVSRAVIDALRGLKVLLILDNCEHVVESVGPVIDNIVESCDGVSILTTSRQSLELADERVYTLQPLGMDSGAQLLGDRAGRSGATDEQIGSETELGELSKQLEGIPLAIELAAVRMRSMSCADITARLDHRLELLSGQRTGHAHKNLRSTIQWSFDLLTHAQQQFFVTVSAFTGGFTADAATRLWIDAKELRDDPAEDSEPFAVLELIDELVDKSMLSRQPSPAGMTARYHVLETLREFAREQVDQFENVALADVHLSWCEDLVADADALARGAGLEVGLATMRSEWGNVAAAVAHAFDTEQLAAAAGLLNHLMFTTWITSGPEAPMWAERLAERLATSDDADAFLPAGVHGLLGLAVLRRGRNRQAIVAFDRALASDPDPAAELAIRIAKGAACFTEGGTDEGRETVAELLRLNPRDDALGPMGTSSHIAYCLLTAKMSPVDADVGYAKCHRELARRPNPATEVLVLFNEAFSPFVTGDTERMSQLLEAALQLSTDHGLHHFRQHIVSVLIMMPGEAGLRWSVKAVRDAVTLKDRALCLFALEAGALILLEGGEVAVAAEILGQHSRQGSYLVADRRAAARDVIATLDDAESIELRGYRATLEETVDLFTHAAEVRLAASDA